MAKQTAPSLPTADQYIAEYLARRLNPTEKAKKQPLLDRVTAAVEHGVLNTVADSKAFGSRVSAAWDAADEAASIAYAEETRRQAERAARRLGLH